MRAVVGPVVLIGIAAVSLFFAQDREGTPAARPSGSAVVGAETSQPSTVAIHAPSPGPAETPTGETGRAAEPTSTADDVDVEVEPEGTPIQAGAEAIPRDARQADRFAAATAAATAFMRAFARPPAGVSGQQWWDGVRPQLAARTVADYEGTNPASVPFTRVTGPAVVIPTDAPSDLLTAVRVPTDAGDYLVELETDHTGLHITRSTPVGGSP